MIDVRRLRNDLEGVRTALARKGVDGSAVDRAAFVDAQARQVVDQRDDLRARKNALSKQIGEAFRARDTVTAESLRAESKDLEGQEADLETRAAALQAELREILMALPNPPSPDAPDGASEADNLLVRTEHFDPARYGPHQRVPHWEIGTQLGILDMERGAKISGSMFALFRGAGATLQRALCQLAIDRNVDAYEEVRPPSLVRTETVITSGQLPKFADEQYHLERDDLWAIATAEDPLTSVARDEVLDEADLPMRLMAYTPCFRREAGAAGRDTRGLLRVHEFDKVELMAYATPEQAPAMLDEILQRAIATAVMLGLPYRVLDICTGDLGQKHHRQFDVETYAPGCDMWLEISSVTWFTDYQARRGNIRYRPSEGRGTELVHTLNGSALAVPRIWAAVVETYRQPDGSIALPEVLHPYFRGATTITAR